MTAEAGLRILLVEDDPEFAVLVRHVLLSHLPEGSTVDVAGLLRSGLERASSTAYDAVLLDLNLPDSAGFDTFIAFRKYRPDAILMVLTAQEDESLGLQAVRAGAEEYLLKTDLRPQSLARQVRYAIERGRLKRNLEHPRQPGLVCTFLPSSGGVGATTLCLNMAAVLAAAGKSALAVELSLEYGAFAARLGVVPQQHLGLVPWDASDRFPLAAVSAVLPIPWGFHVLLGPQHADQYRERFPQQTRLLVESVTPLFDYVLIDAGGAGLAVQGALQRSNLVIVVAERTPSAVPAVRAAGEFLRAAGVPDASCGIAVVTRLSLMESTPAAEICDGAGYRLLAVIPPAAEALQSTGPGLPLALAQPGLAFSEAIRELAHSLAAASPSRLAA